MTESLPTGALVSTDWLAQHGRRQDIRLIEIAGLGQEDQKAYRSGHIPGAICWNWKDRLWDRAIRNFPAPDEFLRQLTDNGIGDTTAVVIYGEPVQFGIYAWWALRYCGHERTYLLDGGRHAWTANGHPLTTDPVSALDPTSHGTVQPRENMRATRERVLAVLERPGDAIILDGRSPEEFRGERVGAPGGPDTGAVRYGRIPGARHLYYADLLDSQTRFKPAPALRQLISDLGVDSKKPVITYCRMGHRATVLYFALTELLGFPDVRVYDGSWTEWGNMVGMPIER